MRSGVLRTNLFHFDPAGLPSACQYRASERYHSAWSLLQKLWQEKNKGYLPTTGLIEMLAILSRGPAWANTNPARDATMPVIATLIPLDIAVVNRALHLWALDVIRQSGTAGPSTADLVANLTIVEQSPLSPQALLQAGQPVPGLAYTVIPWLIASVMAGTPMSSTVPLSLRLTSQGDLLAWDNPIVAESKQRRAIAIHCIEPKLVLLRGESAPLIAVRVHLSHLLPQWKHKTRHAWLDINGSISKLGIHTVRIGDGKYETRYSGPSDRLLGHLGIDQFPRPGVEELSASGNLRPIHAHTPSTPLIANGTGPLFLDQACWHLARTIKGSEAVLADRVVGSLRKSTTSGADVSVGSAPVLALTAHARTVIRLNTAHRLMSDPQNTSFKGGRLPHIKLSHLSPAEAQPMLCGASSGTGLADWFEREVAPELRRTEARTAIVETSMEAAKGRADLDPKFQLRRLFAAQNVTTQFIFDTEPGETDYSANATLAEVVRQSGALPAPMLRLRTLPPETTAVSIYLDSIKTKGAAAYLPVITRITIEAGGPEVFCFDEQATGPRWVDYRTGIARIHASPKLFTGDEVKTLVARALLAPTSSATTPLIVYVHSGLRALYSGLLDKGGEVLPVIANDGAWLVRIRADETTAQVSGDQVKHPAEAGYIGPRIGLYKPRRGASLYYFVSPSNQYGRVISQRHNTRFDVVNRALRDPWQQLGVTEIALLRPGNFGTEDEIAHQTALLCRNAPMWEGNLRLPAPMHMARQIAHDHPLIEINRRLYAD